MTPHRFKPLLDRAFLKAALHYEFEDYLASDGDEPLRARLAEWAGREVKRETQAEAVFIQRFFAPDGTERLIEVKTTVGHALTPFFLSENEPAFSEERQDAFRLVGVYDFARRPAGFALVPPLVDW